MYTDLVYFLLYFCLFLAPVLVVSRSIDGNGSIQPLSQPPRGALGVRDMLIGGYVILCMIVSLSIY